MVRFLFLAFFLLLTFPAAAQENAFIEQVMDDGRLITKAGETIRLAGLYIPREEKATIFLKKKLLNQNVKLVPSIEPINRHGEKLADIYLENDAWLQAEMVKAGLAQVYGAGAAKLYAFENMARKNKAGLWQDGMFKIYAADAVIPINQFAIIEGHVVNAAQVKSNIYVNFGADWKTDFTLTVPRGLRADCRKAGFDPLTLAGKNIRLRGFVTSHNGAMITLLYPEQVEILP